MEFYSINTILMRLCPHNSGCAPITRAVPPSRLCLDPHGLSVQQSWRNTAHEERVLLADDQSPPAAAPQNVFSILGVMRGKGRAVPAGICCLLHPEVLCVVMFCSA